ncbi:MAG: hypothetical protein M3Y35_14215, partial [Actinomycetota bacterium]|nr:hypothetical protein [Actinomycetota bacterium]
DERKDVGDRQPRGVTLAPAADVGLRWECNRCTGEDRYGIDLRSEVAGRIGNLDSIGYLRTAIATEGIAESGNG